MTATEERDHSGVLQVVGSAAAFAALWTFLYLTFFNRTMPALPAIVVGLVAAGAGVYVQVASWDRLGGREAVVETNRWIRKGSIPSDVPSETWMPRLRKLERDARSRYNMPVLAVLQIPIAIINLARHLSAAEQLLWWVIIVFWVGVAVWVLITNRGRLSKIRRLLRTPHPVLPTNAGHN